MHECTPTLTAGEVREATALLKRAISTSPDKGILQLPKSGAVKCIQYHLSCYIMHLTIPYTCSMTFTCMHLTTDHSCLFQDCDDHAGVRHIVSRGEPSAPMENKVLTLSDEERKSLLQKASIAIGSAEVLAIKADMAIPWNGMRLLRQ